MEDHHRKVTLLMSPPPQAASRTAVQYAPVSCGSWPQQIRATPSTGHFPTRRAVHEQIRFDGIGKSGFELLVAAGEIENRQRAVEREAQLVFQAALQRGRDEASCGS
jgi:hypothetical protein